MWSLFVVFLTSLMKYKSHHRPVSKDYFQSVDEWRQQSSGRRNRMTRPLTVRVCLKMNMGILHLVVVVLWLTQKRKWMQNVHHNHDTSEWLSLTKPTLAYEWCSLYWRVKVTQNSLHVITVCCFLTSLMKGKSQRKVNKIYFKCK